ncbi:MAG: hypothetical protein F6K30_15800 [Cyanothece sp. SIO2G6]|nr:hypothetical protein [Cyanothece sp. SIO2G6]
MRLLRSVLPILILGAVIIFAVENWSPTVPLVILGSETIALPLSLWLVMACSLGMLTVGAIALCLHFLIPSVTTATANQPPIDPHNGSHSGPHSGPREPRTDPRDQPRNTRPFQARSPAPTQTPTAPETSQPLEDWEEFSRPRSEWGDWQPRSTVPNAGRSTTSAKASSPSKSAQSSWFSPGSKQSERDTPQVTEVDFEDTQPPVSRFASRTEDWTEREQRQKANEWSDRPQSSTASQDSRSETAYHPSERATVPDSDDRTATGNYDYRDSDYRDRDHRDRDYRDRDYRDYGYRDDEYRREPSQASGYRDSDYRGSDYDENAHYQNDRYYTDDYANRDEPYRPEPSRDGYGYDPYGAGYNEPYQQQAESAPGPDGDYRDYENYESQQGAYAGPYGNVPEGESPQEQFIIDYGDEAALDAFEVTLSQSSSGQYRWKPSSSRDTTDTTGTDVSSTIDEDLEELNDWEGWEDDNPEPRNQDDTNAPTEADSPRPIREVQRNPIATQQSGSVYSYSYRQEEPAAEEQTPGGSPSQTTQPSE